LIFIGICELALGKKKTTQEKLSSNLPGNQSFRVEGLPFQIAPENPQEEISRTNELSFPARFPLVQTLENLEFIPGSHGPKYVSE